MAKIPELTPVEWELLRDGLDRLPEDVAAQVGRRIGGMTAERPIVCPFLDLDAGARRPGDGGLGDPDTA